jgi:hypothetical protein
MVQIFDLSFVNFLYHYIIIWHKNINYYTYLYLFYIPFSTLASSTLIILFSEMLEIFKKNYFFQIKKILGKENKEYLGIFHVLK